MEAQKRDLDSFFNKWIFKFNKFSVWSEQKKGCGKLRSFSVSNYVHNDAIYWDGKEQDEEGIGSGAENKSLILDILNLGWV